MKVKRLLPVPVILLVSIVFFLVVIGTYTNARGLMQSTDKVTINDHTSNGGAISEHNGAVAIITRYDVKEDYLQQLRDALSSYATNALANESNIMVEIYYEQGKPSVLWSIERWTSKSEQLAFNNSTLFPSLTALSEKALLRPAERIYMKDLEPLSKIEWRRKAAENDTPLTIMLFVDAKPGTAKSFQRIYHAAMPQFRSEPGVVNYQLSQFEDDSTRFVTYEKFRNEDAFQYHLKFPPIQPVIDYLNRDIRQQPFQDGLHRLIEATSVLRQ